MVDLAELVEDEPYRELRSLRSPARHNDPQPPGVPPTLGGTLAAAADPFGIPSAIAGDLVSPELRDKWRGQYEGEVASQLIGGALTGGPVAKGIGAVARPVIEAVRAHKFLGPTAVGAAALPFAADAAGVQTDRPAESFEVPLPEPDPKMIEEHNAIQDKIGTITPVFESKLQELEKAFQSQEHAAQTAFQVRSTKQYPTQKARELDAQQFENDRKRSAEQHERAKEAIRQQWNEQVNPLREEAKEIATRIRWQQENQKKERQAAAKAEADAAAAKAAKERPLVEQYPALLALPYIGGAYAAGVTYNARRQAIKEYDAWVKQAGEQLRTVDKLVADVEKTGKKVVRPSTETIEREKKVLSGFVEKAPKAEKAATSSGFLPAAASGGFIAGELAMVPYLIDWATQEPESAAGKEARHRLASIDGWMKTATSMLAGVTGAGIGATLPVTKASQFPMQRAKVMAEPGGYSTPGMRKPKMEPSAKPASKPAAQPRQTADPVGIPPAQFSPAAAKARQKTEPRQKTADESLQSIEQQLASGQN